MSLLEIVAGVLLAGLVSAGPTWRPADAQHQQALSPDLSSPETGAGLHRQHLILKDGTYQIVISYRVIGDRVVYISAERGGQQEEIPLELVDLAATRKWEAEHGPNANPDGQSAPAPVLSPELQKEEAERATLAPEVAPDLRLDPTDNVLALDVFRGTPELVPLLQSSTDLTESSQHSILKGLINPHSASHQMVELQGQSADVQMHVSQPVFYLRIDDAQEESGSALTVDTHGAADSADRRPKTSSSQYAIVRVDVREGARIVASFNTSALGSTRQEENVVDTTATPLPGGHWLKIMPREPMLFGEYALVEVLGENQINLGVWAFGVHPTAPENRDVLLPQKRRPEGLGHRPE